MPPDSYSAHTSTLGKALNDGIAALHYCSLLTVNAEQQESVELVLESAKKYGRDALASGDDYEIRRNLDIIHL